MSFKTNVYALYYKIVRNKVYPLPYFFDIINYGDIRNEALKGHIDSKGIVLWER